MDIDVHRLAQAASAVLNAVDANRDAINGQGHEGSHDRAVHMDPCTSIPDLHIYDTFGDCAACGGAQYGTEDTLSQAYGDLRAALGQPRKPWEYE